MTHSRSTLAVLARLRQLASGTCGFSLEQVDDTALLFKIDGQVRKHGSLGTYLSALEVDGRERQAFIEALCTHETRFFRHEAQFRYLMDVHLPLLRREMETGNREKRIRAWSVACSTGEEPTSVAVALCNAFGEGVACRVLGTDISNAALERARELRWPVEARKSIPEALLRAYFLRGVGNETGYLRPTPRVREALHFEQANLLEACEPYGQNFELIFCRNVLIYFDASTRAKIATRLLHALAPGGLLFTGPSEGVARAVDDVHMVVPHVYRRKVRT